MKKFFIALVLSITLIVGLGAICANASSSGTCGDNLTWVLGDAGTFASRQGFQM